MDCKRLRRMEWSVVRKVMLRYYYHIITDYIVYIKFSSVRRQTSYLSLAPLSAGQFLEWLHPLWKPQLTNKSPRHSCKQNKRQKVIRCADFLLCLQYDGIFTLGVRDDSESLCLPCSLREERRQLDTSPAERQCVDNLSVLSVEEIIREWTATHFNLSQRTHTLVQTGMVITFAYLALCTK